MGFRLQQKIYNLVFENELAGLNIQATGLPVGAYLKLSMAFGKDNDVSLEAAEEAFKIFASCVLSWNLEDDQGNPIPPTVEGLTAIDITTAMNIIAAWVNAVVGVSPELGKGSPSGATFPEGQLPVEVA
jgi:hypothetical protein